MEKHPNHAGVVKYACTALYNLACNAANRMAIIALGGVAVAARAAQQNWMGDSDVQVQADSLVAKLL